MTLRKVKVRFKLEGRDEGDEGRWDSLTGERNGKKASRPTIG